MTSISSSQTARRPSATETVAASLSAEVEAAESIFDFALRSGDADGAARSILDLEGAIHRWSADTLQSDEMDRARASLRSMIVRLADAARSGLTDPRAVLGPYIDALIELRARVREGKRYDLSDLVRDRLGELGVDVHDTAQGATWELRSAQ